MTATVRRITISLPKDQIRSIKNVSKILNQSVSSLISELVGESVASFEELIINNDINGAKSRISKLTADAQFAIDAVEKRRSQN